MAGDWIKMELTLPDKPEVHYIANALNIDPDAVIGKLLRVWAWFDMHTENGNALGVTFALVDRLTCVSGFGEAMQFAGWLEQRDKLLCMVNFDRHTSESAKKRALTAKRQSKFRNAPVTQPVTLTALPREEKRRDITPLPPSGEFERFWSCWPKSARKASKGKCAEIWKRKILDPIAEQIIAHVEAMKKTEGWRTGYDPAPLSYLNQSRWDGAELPAESDKPSHHASW